MMEKARLIANRAFPFAFYFVGTSVTTHIFRSVS